VEAYGIALSNGGWWDKNKRGRGAKARDDKDAAKLILALLSAGPTELRQFFIPYSNLCPLPESRDDPLMSEIRGVLGVERKGLFLEYITGLIGLYKKGETDALIFRPSHPEGFLDDYMFDGPNVDITIKGPFRCGSISFLLSHQFIDRMVKKGHDPAALLGHKQIVFVDQFYGWRADALEKGESSEGYDRAIDGLRQESSRGIRFERSIGGREVQAVADALRSGGGE
jgi:hypothetical protein